MAEIIKTCFSEHPLYEMYVRGQAKIREITPRAEAGDIDAQNNLDVIQRFVDGVTEKMTGVKSNQLQTALNEAKGKQPA